ncbi:alpha-mannosidase [Virgibacillus profundi]|uniref:Alpha-mannosidase n=1 Tax=Virgibacillus profundi TaxID=2024555 RepID=A0A2A2IHW1_9BACI|nr:alpha-mannosidase [Virgibacillus profundi]PAV31217.1 alpha-mannosidase [Virgibacillus profundi]PXY55400.1 alpha-mannosidase [Virgibacillus profundi]
MKDNKQVHIISHTHWDREWYLPYEKHHVLLIKLMDKLLATLEADPDFKSFHLDGQTIILDDYLQVRPEKREILKKYIQEGRLHIGPWYILQDEFLTSSEANIRNLQYGIKDATKWGGISKVGYFPDSFGNMGQGPQILSQAGINNAVFGRGVKPTGFNNTVSESDNFESPYSEMHWRSPDGSSVLGILFANWYCNGNEIPTDSEEAKNYWEQHMDSLEKYAATPHMLMMNGCDHQPIQADLPEAIRTAKELYPNVEFVHSNFNEYVEKLTASVPEDLKVIDGELRSQQTDGWGTLVNTASSRVYIKQMNQVGQTLLEKVAEPLATFAYMQGEEYNGHLLEYAWKTLMQNHPHDSICGCSVDEVHSGMITRFENSKHVAEMLIDESLEAVSKKINTSGFEKWGEDALPFTVYNTTGWERTGTVSITLDVKREYFSNGVNKEQLKSFPFGQRIIVDESGNEFSCTAEDLGIAFDYDLPEEKFRQPYMARRVRLTFEAGNVPALGLKTFAWVQSEKQQEDISLITADNEMENEFLHVKINKNGSLTLMDKATGKTYKELGVYEDTGDIGNEYMYKQPENDTALTTKDVSASVRVAEDTPFQAVYEITHEWEIPESASELLEKEQNEVVWFTGRKAERSDKKITFTIKTLVSLQKNGKGVDVKASFNNQVKDHRLRVLFPTDIETDVHHADSIFEVAKRSIQPSKEWTNPDYSQHQQAFVDVRNQEQGLTISNLGLNEYEVLRDGRNTIAVTLLRSVGEMGDWGHFPTPEAQCLGEQSASFRIYPSNGEAGGAKAYQDAYQYQIPWSVKQTGIHDGELPAVHSFLQWESENLAFSSLKVSDKTGDVMARWFNITDKDSSLAVHTPDDIGKTYKSNVLEEEKETINNEEGHSVRGHEIITVGFEKR